MAFCISSSHQFVSPAVNAIYTFAVFLIFNVKEMRRRKKQNIFFMKLELLLFSRINLSLFFPVSLAGWLRFFSFFINFLAQNVNLLCFTDRHFVLFSCYYIVFLHFSLFSAMWIWFLVCCGISFFFSFLFLALLWIHRSYAHVMISAWNGYMNSVQICRRDVVKLNEK